LITSNKQSVKNFLSQCGTLINKSINESFTEVLEDTHYFNRTERVTTEDINLLDDTFFPTLFQAEISKRYELRIVFVKNFIWAGAIFSQNDSQTALDWRNYNYEKPNRVVPYRLPKVIQQKIRKFAMLTRLNTGAIDMIVTVNQEYVFLECNPNGQISMLSQKCNYPIEQHIINTLIT
jgi:hypothetical protein